MDILDSLSNIGFDWRIALANLVNFAIVFFLLSKFIFKPMQAKIDERKEKIAEGLESAAKAERDRIMAEEAYKARVAEAEKTANSIIADARDKETRIVEEASGEAVQKAERIVADAKKKASLERKDMEEQFERDAIHLVLESTEKILRENIDKEKNEKIIRKMLKARV